MGSPTAQRKVFFRRATRPKFKTRGVSCQWHSNEPQRAQKIVAKSNVIEPSTFRFYP